MWVLRLPFLSVSLFSFFLIFFLLFIFSSFVSLSLLFLVYFSLFFISSPLSFSPPIYFFLSYPQIFIELFCARHGAPRSGVLASAPELCWFLPPLQALGMGFQQFPGEQGGRRHGAGRVRKTVQLAEEDGTASSPSAWGRNVQFLLPSLRFGTPFIWSKTL